MPGTNSESDDAHFLRHPEVVALFGPTLQALVGESDRGAVLIAAQLVDNSLRRLFEELAPPDLSRKTLKSLLDYPGPLSTSSSKVNLAVLARLVPAAVGKAIHRLREIRNAVAHSPDSFRLQDHTESLRQVFDIGPGVPVGVNRVALELLTRNVINHLLTVPHPLEGKPIFTSPEQIIDYLLEHRDLLDQLGEHQLRWELGIGVALLCGAIVFHRERTVKALAGHGLVGDLFGQANS
ncbi:MAG TPA: hypothetical protein VGS57_17185 [Thermoanaerobaculia bacterium]|jgi:hypothetical protein|nr:hypothetical protein [Thermoanaerobaculia bacterium]